MKPSSLLLIESWYKSLIGRFTNQTVQLGLHEKHQTEDIYSLHHNGRHGNIIYVCQIERVRASAAHAYNVVYHNMRFGHAMLDRYVLCG